MCVRTWVRTCLCVCAHANMCVFVRACVHACASLCWAPPKRTAALATEAAQSLNEPCTVCRLQRTQNGFPSGARVPRASPLVPTSKCPTVLRGVQRDSPQRFVPEGPFSPRCPCITYIFTCIDVCMLRCVLQTWSATQWRSPAFWRPS